MATLNDRKLIDLVGFMTMYSQIAYPLFIWSVWFYRKRNLNEFSLMDFCAYVRLDHVSVRQPEQCLLAMDKRVKNKLHELERRHPEAIEEIKVLSMREALYNEYLLLTGIRYWKRKMKAFFALESGRL
jgi:hypothetical protein